MPKETEIKLRVSPETLQALKDHPLLKKRSKTGWERHELYNQYYDTPARDLAANKVAVRVRRDGDAFIQTLKSRGVSVAGLSERSEFEWPIKSSRLNTSKLTDDCWPAALADLDKKTLKPLFTTDFVRHKTDIAWGRGKARVELEAALDEGAVIAGTAREPICELELELRQGDPAALLELAEQLAADLPLMPCDISKAERGYRLFDEHSYPVQLPTPSLSTETSVDDSFAALAWHLLGASQRLAEQYRWNGHWRLLADWLRQLIDLRALLGSIGQAVPRSRTAALRAPLDALLDHWRPLIEQGNQDEQVRQRAPAAFAEEMTRTRWGQFSLGLSRWLLARDWCVERNARGDKQGALALGRGLPRQLADEAVALGLTRALNQGDLLRDQLPRLERLLVWLRLARPVLEIEESDRLYGEMSKLHEALLLRAPAEELAAQARVLVTLKAWKALLQ